jgi:hypothetical protein
MMIHQPTECNKDQSSSSSSTYDEPMEEDSPNDGDDNNDDQLMPEGSLTSNDGNGEFSVKI